MSNRKTRVLIVEDSKLYQIYLKRIIDADPMLETAGIAGNGQEALSMVSQLQPDVITLDLHLPDVSQYELLKTLVRTRSTPIIVVTSLPSACEEAIRLGARDFVAKQDEGGKYAAEQFALILKLKIKTQASANSALSRPLPSSAQRAAAKPPAGQEGIARRDRIIAIGASLGGTEATLRVLRQLPDTLPGIVIVQHMPKGFTNAYALRLDQNCHVAVREAKNGDAVLPGTALVAPGGIQLRVFRDEHEKCYRVRCVGEEKYGGFCPAVDVMFSSVAACAGKKATGVLLTGMGRDGAEGLLQMRNAGAHTIAQDKDSCVVFGMPGAAWEKGAVDVLMPPDEIAEALTNRG